MDPQFFTQVEEGLSLQKFNRLIKKKLNKAFPMNSGKSLRDVKALIVPINIRQCHWLLMVVDFERGEFVVVDSMGCSLTRGNEY
jgi:hypothetical protein